MSFNGSRLELLKPLRQQAAFRSTVVPELARRGSSMGLGGAPGTERTAVRGESTSSFDALAPRLFTSRGASSLFRAPL